MFERDFVGFLPDDFLDLYLDAMLRRVAEHAPYDSNCHAIVEASPRRGYNARITVETSTGAFVGESTASDAKLALDLAEEHLFQRFAEWLKTRWDDKAA